jgi:hypothetical protein
LWQYIPFLILFFGFWRCTNKKALPPTMNSLGSGKKNALFRTLQTMFSNRQIYTNFQPDKSDFNLLYTKDFAWSKNIEGICFFFLLLLYLMYSQIWLNYLL